MNNLDRSALDEFLVVRILNTRSTCHHALIVRELLHRLQHRRQVILDLLLPATRQ